MRTFLVVALSISIVPIEAIAQSTKTVEVDAWDLDPVHLATSRGVRKEDVPVPQQAYDLFVVNERAIPEDVTIRIRMIVKTGVDLINSMTVMLKQGYTLKLRNICRDRYVSIETAESQLNYSINLDLDYGTFLDKRVGGWLQLPCVSGNLTLPIRDTACYDPSQNCRSLTPVRKGSE